MKIILLCCFIVLASVAHAQDTTAKQTNTKDSLTSVRIEARFPGGPKAWAAYLETAIHPNVAAKHKAPAGNYTVQISFLVDVAGKVSNVEILTDPGYSTGEDVLKALQHSPDWLPATINGKPVVYRQKQNITYQVSEK